MGAGVQVGQGVGVQVGQEAWGQGVGVQVGEGLWGWAGTPCKVDLFVRLSARPIVTLALLR